MGLIIYNLETAIEIAEDISKMDKGSSFYKCLASAFYMNMKIISDDVTNDFVHVDTIEKDGKKRYQGYWKFTGNEKFNPDDFIWIIDGEIRIDDSDNIYIVVWNGEDLPKYDNTDELPFG